MKRWACRNLMEKEGSPKAQASYPRRKLVNSISGEIKLLQLQALTKSVNATLIIVAIKQIVGQVQLGQSSQSRKLVRKASKFVLRGVELFEFSCRGKHVFRKLSEAFVGLVDSNFRHLHEACGRTNFGLWCLCWTWNNFFL